MKNKNLNKLVLSAMFIAIGLVLPFLTGQIKQIGNMLLPMHLPVILCGLICGWQYGIGTGFILPLLRSAIFGMPTMYPNAVAMAFELATYGFVVGFLYAQTKKQNVLSIYKCLIIAMISGRVVWGVVEVILLGMGGAFTYEMFIAGAFLNSIPGIVLQLVLIPALMVLLDRTGIVKFKKV